MATSGDYFSEEQNFQPANTVAEVRDRFIAAGLPCEMEHKGDKVRLTFADRKCYLAFKVNAEGKPLAASMPETEGYDAEFAQIVFSVFESIGWKFQQ